MLSFLALLVTGVEILISHPRFYWGETGNVNTRPLFTIPIPSSRPSVPTGYGYVLPDQNGWSRYLHFQSAWIVVGTGLLYVAFGFFGGHFRRNLLPARSDLSPKRLGISILQHLRFERPSAKEAWSYNVLQRLAYLVVIFLCFPLIIWTGLAMSPAFESLAPSATLLGGHQSARTIHFFVTGFLVAVPSGSCADDYSCWIPKSHARHDQWPRHRASGASMSKLSRRKSLPPGWRPPRLFPGWPLLQSSPGAMDSSRRMREAFTGPAKHLLMLRSGY